MALLQETSPDRVILRMTVFMQKNFQLLSTQKPTFVKLCLSYRPICVKKWSKIII